METKLSIFQIFTVNFLILTIGFTMATSATVITVDEIIYEAITGIDESVYAGSITMELIGQVLTITLKNESTGEAVAGSGGSENLLTGLAFNLPNNVAIAGGDVNTGGSQLVNFNVSDKDVSKEWGFDNNPLDSGPFLDSDIVLLTYNTVVSSMVSLTSNQFELGTIDASPGLSGPGFGLLSASVDDTAGAAGLEAIKDMVIISLNLNGDTSDLINLIQADSVAISFASPNYSMTMSSGDGVSTIPEPSTFMLIGFGLAFFGIQYRRKRSSVPISSTTNSGY
jgi:hypothetical protein